MRSILGLLLIASAALISSGCASNSQHAKIMPGVDLNAYRNFYVVEEAEDNREVGQVIADELLSRNMDVSIGPEAASSELTEVLVYYDSKWHWDMTPYLWSLNIRFQDASSQVPLATATSEHSSLTRKTKRGMVREVLHNIFTGDISIDSKFFAPILAEDLNVHIGEIDRPQAITAKVIGYGVQFVSDDEFNAALTTAVERNNVFQTVGEENDYLLTVAVNSLEADYTVLIMPSNSRNVATTATWTLTQTGSKEAIFTSKIVSVCEEDSMKDYYTVSKMAACSIRENLRAGLRELVALELDTTTGRISAGACPRSISKSQTKCSLGASGY